MFNSKKSSKKQGFFGGSNNNKKKSKSNSNNNNAVIISGLAGAVGTMAFNMITGGITDYGRNKVRQSIENRLERRANEEIASDIEDEE